MSKKSAIGTGILLLIALLFFFARGKGKPAPPPAAARLFRTDYVTLALPSNAWSCLRQQDQNACLYWECHDRNSQRTDLSVVRIQWRPLTAPEKDMDGRYVNLETPMPCGPDLSQVPMSAQTTALLESNSWREIHTKGFPNDEYDSRFFITRDAGMAIQVEVSVKIGPYQDDTARSLKPLVESLQTHGIN